MKKSKEKKPKKEIKPVLTHGSSIAVVTDMTNALRLDESLGNGYHHRETTAVEVYVALLSGMLKAFPGSSVVENMSWLQAMAFKELKRKNKAIYKKPGTP